LVDNVIFLHGIVQKLKTLEVETYHTGAVQYKDDAHTFYVDF